MNLQNGVEEEGVSPIPSSLSQVGIVLKYTFLDYLRSKRFFVMVVIALLIGAGMTAGIGYYRPIKILSYAVAFYSDWWVGIGGVTFFVILLSGVFFGGDAISGEFQGKTGYYLLSNPIKRSSICIGKWLSAYLASSFIIGLSALIAIANQLYYFGWTFPYQFGEALLFSWVYLASILGITFLVSSLFKSNALSILVSIIVLSYGFVLIQNILNSFAKMEPWFVLSYASGIIANILTATGYPEHAVATNLSPHVVFQRWSHSDNL